MSILVVEDEPAVLRSVIRWLSAVGHDCRAAATVTEANELLALEQFELAVVDVSVGANGGVALAAMIRESHPHTAVIMVSGAADFAAVDEAHAAGLNEFLAKPLTPAAVFEAAQRALAAQALHSTELPKPSRATSQPTQRVVDPLRTLEIAQARAAPPRIDALFRAMVQRGASDLHISAGNPPLIRKDGEIMTLDPAPLTADDVVQFLAPIVPGKNRAEFEERHDTDFAYEIDGLARFRANLFADRKGPGAVFRRVPATITSAEELGLSPAIIDLCSLRKGLVLVTGPTGSGKSTTLAAMIDYINRTRTDHIVTIEDPIEFVHENKRCLINQREMHTHTASFRSALRAALREDPDVVLIGEMRDLETVSIALETAETGHLVFGTLHTSTAASTVDRLIDQFSADTQEQVRVLVAESLRAVIAQTLCRRVGGGRVAAMEVLVVTPAISNLIRERKTFQIPSMMQLGRAAGRTTLSDALADLVGRGLITADEARLHTTAAAGRAGNG
jgi:twitching motility protein PilT